MGGFRYRIEVKVLIVLIFRCLLEVSVKNFDFFTHIVCNPYDIKTSIFVDVHGVQMGDVESA